MNERLFYRDQYGQHFYDATSGKLFSHIRGAGRIAAEGGPTLNKPSGTSEYSYSNSAYEWGSRRGLSNKETEKYFEGWMHQAARDTGLLG